LELPSVLVKALPVPQDAFAQLPLKFSAQANERFLTFEIAYNDFAHLFTMTVFNEEGQELLTGALVYGMDFCEPFQYIEELRGLRIVPFDMALRHEALTPENFGQDVQLYYAEV
jgi:hypothetical protein